MIAVVLAFLGSYWWLVAGWFVGYQIWELRARFHPTLPAPGAHWFWGMVPTYKKHRSTLHDWWYECHVANDWKPFQQPLAFYTKTKATIIITSDPRNIKHILKDHFENYIKGPNFRGQFHDLLGDGIFNANGDTWRSQRKIASHMFSLTKLRDEMVKIFERNADTLINVMDGYVTHHQSFDIQDLFMRFTLDSFTEIAFGEHAGALAMKPNPFGVAFDTAQLLINQRATTPGWQIARMLNIGKQKVIQQQLKIINEYAYNMIAKRRHAPDCNTRGDLLSLFFQHQDANPEELTDKYLRDIILNFMIAGRDTTATLMSWCIYELTQNPGIEKKLLTELNAAYEFKQPSYDATTLPYLQAFIYETLRLHPSVPMDGKMAVKDDVFPDGTHVSARTGVWFCPYSMGRSPHIWGPDPLVFRPERWIERESFPTPYEFPQFLAGPRVCLGKQMAIAQASLVLSTILLKFHVSLVPNQQVTYQVLATMPIASGLHVTATRR